MRKQALIAVTMAATFFTACAQTGKTSRTKARAHGKAAQVTTVSMQRGACFGACPEYTLTIKSDGLVTYTGRRNAPKQGTYEKNIGAEAARKLLAEFTDYRVDTLQDNYTARLADLPGLSFVFTVGGTQKSVGNANFGPAFLTAMSERVDALGQVDASWKKTAGPAPAE